MYGEHGSPIVSSPLSIRCSFPSLVSVLEDMELIFPVLLAFLFHLRRGVDGSVLCSSVSTSTPWDTAWDTAYSFNTWPLFLPGIPRADADDVQLIFWFVGNA